ncbi:hypothetical protein TraAM80_06273 [Trypanosoma rangeli]|uniref:Cyclic nucleotide-binding domain-containing protein n=1 Tax=Trypanosoma rangeli TaxID=5698 RepID=A0A3R7RH56_TRYRA|nr:uncharacterized protein TraAM80_06273 [Trypanosoma rangeli]RNF02608.1 hypothetical protein TraAM80_06273 [Trypanosoma rangeli]|eukprot:RNF02608.1 hypothetical protein TraAM80_06273 [Trypanosoma rangeli]
MNVNSPSSDVQQTQQKRKNQEEGKHELSSGSFSAPTNDGAMISLAPLVSVAPHSGTLDASSSRRRSSTAPVVLLSTADVDPASSSRSTHILRRESRRGSLRIRGSVPESLDRAVDMVRTYPLMVVEGTAFENQFFRGGSGDCTMLNSMGSLTSLSNVEDAETSVSGLTDVLGHLRLNSSVVSFASRLKRACMWSVIILAVRVHCAWREAFRRQVLRAALEQLLLPIILQRRGENGVAKRIFRRPHCIGPELLRDDDGLNPQGNFIWDNCEFFRSLGSQSFCEELTKVVLRHRHFSGNAIVSVGAPSQDAMHILVSGRCDAITPSSEANNKVQRSRLAVGASFGGIFGGREVYTKVYRAISQCVVWVIPRNDFEVLFSRYADNAMKEIYLNALKRHHMERLLRSYPLPQCMSRVPIYRHIDREIEDYAKDFTPLVLTKGDVLFEQGEPPGDVYCLLEGEVQRQQLGADMTYEGGTSQILSPHESDNKFSLSTRFLLLGEEPHILPAPLRYKCSVFSRFALFFKVKGDRFVDALLDDAKLFLRIRANLTAQIRSSMRLSTEALVRVPLLREMSGSHLHNILNAAEPRVVERYTSICEPAQAVREIYLLTAGEVQDPRQFNRVATLPMSPPASEEEEAPEDTHPKGKKERNPKHIFTGQEKGGKMPTCPRPHETVVIGRIPFRGDSELTPVSLGTPHSQWSFFQGNNHGDFTNGITYPDEQHDLAPALPPNPAKNFLCTVGGGWEGLLVEKWPNGWETSTTVELWAIPALTIRTEFNSLPDSLQKSILLCARTMQMHALGLSSIVVAKLPPMSVFVPPEKRVKKTSLVLERGQTQEKSITTHKRKYAASGHSYERSTPSGSRRGRVTGDLSRSHASTLSGSSPSFLENEDMAFSRKMTSQRRALRPSPLSQTPSKKSPVFRKKEKNVKIEPKDAASNVDLVPTEAPKPKAGPPPLLFLRKLASKLVEKPPIITREMCALYAGQEPQKGIIRQLQPIANKVAGAANNAVTFADQKPSWPVASGAQKQWFHVVPSFAPLPGTVNNHNYIGSTPSLLPNTALMVRREKGYGDVLVSQANYFVDLAHARREQAMRSELASAPSPGEAKGLLFSMRSASPNAMGRPVPGRHAYRL